MERRWLMVLVAFDVKIATEQRKLCPTVIACIVAPTLPPCCFACCLYSQYLMLH